jgi:hypothetical protein
VARLRVGERMPDNDTGLDRFILRRHRLEGREEAEYVRPEGWRAPDRHWHWSEPPGTRLQVRNDPGGGLLDLPRGMHGGEMLAVVLGWLLIIGGVLLGVHAAFGSGWRFLAWFVPVGPGVLLLMAGERVVRIERAAEEVSFVIRWGLFLRRRVRRTLAQRPAFSGRVQSRATTTRHQRWADHLLVVSRPALLVRHRTLHTACTRYEGSWIVAELEHWSYGAS